jgi:hypothetical protein
VSIAKGLAPIENFHFLVLAPNSFFPFCLIVYSGFDGLSNGEKENGERVSVIEKERER